MANRFKQLGRLLDRAEGAYRRADLNSAWDACATVLNTASQCPDLDDQAILAARAHEIQAVILQDRGESESALRSYQAAEQALLDRPKHRVFLGRVQLSLIQQCAVLDLDDAALDYLSKATTNLAGSEYEAYLPDSSDWVVDSSEATEWRDRVQQLDAQIADMETTRPDGRRHWRRAARRGDVHVRKLLDLRRQAARLRIQYGDDEEAADGLMMYGAMAATLLNEANDYRAFLDLTTATAFLVDRPQLRVDHTIELLTQLAFDAADRTRSPEMLGQAHFLAAVQAYQRRELESALTHALSSVAYGADCLTRTTSTLLRSELKDRLDERRDLALIVAVELEESATAAELIETARLQALPTAGTQLTGPAAADGLAETLRMTLAALGSLSEVSVRGHSQLHGRSQDHFPEPRTVVAIEDAIHLVGGPGAWWWGSFSALRRIHWVVRAPDGTLWSGTRHLGDDAVAAIEAVDEQLGAVSTGDHPVWVDPEEERQQLADLADIVLPPPLRDRLHEGAGESMSLVVCGNWSAAIPLATLVLDRDSDLRLVERAVLRIQPPAFLLDRLRSRPLPAASEHPLLIACMDPDGDLPNSYDSDLPALLSFTHATHDPRPHAQATRANLIEALRRFPPSTPGIFFYSGHVDYLDVNGGLNAVLKLQNGDVLAAGDWHGVFTEHTGIGTPSRVLISACDSAGASGAGGGEWLGLGAAVLSAGARQVIATAWPIYDADFTKRFDARLVLALETAPDPAALLAETQRKALVEWRHTTAIRMSDSALPAIWAAYQCIGTLA